jgi:voltage-gated potassium channel Kch
MRTPSSRERASPGLDEAEAGWLATLWETAGTYNGAGGMMHRQGSSPALERYLRDAARPVAVATLLVVPALLLEATESPLWQRLGSLLNWATWLVLLTHVAVVLWLGGFRAGLRLAGFDIALVLLTVPIAPSTWQSFRVLRLLRVLRLGVAVLVAAHHVRAVLQHRQFHVVALAAGVSVMLGAAGIYRVEHGTNPHIQSLGDALWWAIVTATTVGYGDISPKTPEGRIIAVLMLVGIGVIGAFTATVASFFVTQDEAPDFQQMEARLARVEAKLDDLHGRDSRDTSGPADH